MERLLGDPSWLSCIKGILSAEKTVLGYAQLFTSSDLNSPKINIHIITN
jgi:hypothetical protein